MNKIMLSLGAALLLSACSDEKIQTMIDLDEPRNQKMTVLVGSEVRDFEPILSEIKEVTGVTVEFKYTDTLNGSIEVFNHPNKYDAVWFSQLDYLKMWEKEKKKDILVEDFSIATSPIVLGVKRELAEDWNWSNRVSWKEIATKTKKNKLRFAMSDPTASNSGFSTLISLENAHDRELITRDEEKEILLGQSVTSGSSGWLVDDFVKSQDNLEGIFNYESVLMDLNENSEFKHDLQIIYPDNGVMVADYRFGLVNKYKSKSYQKVVSYLLSEKIQTWMMNETHRRPVNHNVMLSNKFSSIDVGKIRFPDDTEKVEGILHSFLHEFKKPNTSIFVVDISMAASDQNFKLGKEALYTLSGESVQDVDIKPNYFQFRNGEVVVILPFDDIVRRPMIFPIDDENKTSISHMKMFVESLKPKGNPALYDALQEAYRMAGRMKAKDPNRIYSIVLMAGGDNRGVSNYEDFQEYYKNNPSYHDVKTFPIVVNESRGNSFKFSQIAELTGGKKLNIYNGGSLEKDLIKVRNYQ